MEPINVDQITDSMEILVKPLKQFHVYGLVAGAKEA